MHSLQRPHFEEQRWLIGRLAGDEHLLLCLGTDSHIPLRHLMFNLLSEITKGPDPSVVLQVVFVLVDGPEVRGDLLSDLGLTALGIRVASLSNLSAAAYL